ncbi:rhomboid family intramembrane serine protease [Aestuariibaculum sediminum]|uniref:Rhomboid family intramembrane serine protease n=1 Tax=Aestuariibaculum sediminum TaxID=2770637 RepID=A0A8J6Q083_9FLAO|nr:rhomboid family intramembrane serine protease [Aestuariibaculum sediminum]MBD0832237.1 rhomboid family intramembrane serine protease [Aestuariibaculum sediminum]
MIRISETVKHLIIINVIMFIGTMTIGNGVFYEWFAMFFPKNEAFRPWQIITHMFMHGGISHIFFNMFALWMFGTPVEQVLGSKRFLFIYFSAGLGAVALQVGYSYLQYIPMEQQALNMGFTHEQIVQVFKDNKVFTDIGPLFNEIYLSTMVGASGCIMGILAAFGMMNPNAELMMIFLPIPIKAKYFIPGIIILDLISGLSGSSIFGQGNVAHFAHVGGAVIGFIIMWYWKRNQFNQNRWY